MFFVDKKKKCLFPLRYNVFFPFIYLLKKEKKAGLTIYRRYQVTKKHKKCLFLVRACEHARHNLLSFRLVNISALCLFDTHEYKDGSYKPTNRKKRKLKNMDMSKDQSSIRLRENLLENCSQS